MLFGMEKNRETNRGYKIIGVDMKRFLIRESVSGMMHYYYSIEANSEEEAMEIYETTYPSNDDSEFYPDDNGENNMEIVEE